MNPGIRDMVASWCLIGAILLLLEPAFSGLPFVIFSVPIAATWLLCGLILFVVLTVKVWRQRGEPIRAGWVLVMPATLFILPALDPWVSKAEVWIGFSVRRSQYDRIVATDALTSTPGKWTDSSDGVAYYVDPALPHRVAFKWPRGWGLHWGGVVYDSTELLDAVSRAGRNPENAEKARTLFEGRLLYCSSLAKAYYFCDFR